MLEKKSKKQYFDAHFHASLSDFTLSDDIYGCSCAHSIEEWNKQQAYGNQIIQAFGIHPQQLNEKDFDYRKSFDFLETLCKNNQIDAIGEVGFDFFAKEIKNSKELFLGIQDQVFRDVMELSVFYKKPVVIHCRKANEKLFEYKFLLRQVPSVLFHSFMGTEIEAESLLKKEINGFFSFGKQVFNGNKKVINCVKKLPVDRLLFETDAPFQFLKGENCTSESEIKKVYNGAYALHSNSCDNTDFLEFCEIINSNAEKCFTT